MDGFICEILPDKIKLFTLSDGVIDLPLKPDVSLGQFVYIVNEKEYKIIKHPEIPRFKVYSKKGELFVKLLIVGPNELGLPHDLGKKYTGLVWSPHLGLIRDPNEIYGRDCVGDEVALAVVKYAPSGKPQFEVCRIVPTKGEPKEALAAYLKMTPWFLEEMATRFTPIYEQAPESLACTNRTKVLSTENASVGICIDHNVPNPCYSKNRGSPAFVLLLWSPTIGLVRWVIPAKRETTVNLEGTKVDRGDTTRYDGDPLSKLGKWFTFSLNIKNYDTLKKLEESAKKAGRAPTRPMFFEITARSVRELKNYARPTKQLEMVNKDGEVINNFEVICSFAFKHDALEDISNRAVEDWNIRFKKLRKDAHFVDLELGKVEIYPDRAKFLIEKIEAHRNHLKSTNPSEFERLKNETIIVRGSASRIRNYFLNSQTYPKYGLFYLKLVHTICYFPNGELIFKEEEEEEELDKLEEEVAQMAIE